MISELAISDVNKGILAYNYIAVCPENEADWCESARTYHRSP